MGLAVIVVDFPPAKFGAVILLADGWAFFTAMDALILRDEK